MIPGATSRTRAADTGGRCIAVLPTPWPRDSRRATPTASLATRPLTSCRTASSQTKVTAWATMAKYNAIRNHVALNCPAFLRLRVCQHAPSHGAFFFVASSFPGFFAWPCRGRMVYITLPADWCAFGFVLTHCDQKIILNLGFRAAAVCRSARATQIPRRHRLPSSSTTTGAIRRRRRWFPSSRRSALATMSCS